MVCSLHFVVIVALVIILILVIAIFRKKATKQNFDGDIHTDSLSAANPMFSESCAMTELHSSVKEDNCEDTINAE